MKFTKRDLRVNRFSLLVDESDLQLNGSLSNVFNYLYNDEALSMNVSLKGDNVFLEDLATTKEEKIADGKIFALPDNLSGNIQIDIGKVEYGGHRYEELKGRMKIKNRSINFSNLNLRNAGAIIKGNLNIVKYKQFAKYKLKSYY